MAKTFPKLYLYFKKEDSACLYTMASNIYVPAFILHETEALCRWRCGASLCVQELYVNFHD